MAKPRSPDRDKARQIYVDNQGSIKLKDIAAQLGVSETQIRQWKHQDNWDSVNNNVMIEKNNVIKRSAKTRKALAKAVVDADNDLNEKQQAFCFEYVQCFNACHAAARAGYTGNRHTLATTGYKLLQLPKVQEEVKRLRELMTAELLVTPDDVVRQYMKIAFADIGDLASFKGGYIDAKDSSQVDTSLIAEVKQVKDGGLSFKLKDSMKALSWLSHYFAMNPEDKRKGEFDAALTENAEAVQQMLDALNQTAEELNFDEDTGTQV